MNHRGLRTAVVATAILAIGLAAGACGSAKQTPQVIYTTLPTATPVVTPTPEVTATPEGTATVEPTATPAATTPPAAPATPAAPTPTTGPTVEPTSGELPTPAVTPFPSPSGAPGDACAGFYPANKTWIAGAAKDLTKFDVYCATYLPAKWHISGDPAYQTSDTRAVSGGQIFIYYTNGTKAVHTGLISVKEGNFCTTGPSACAPKDHDIASAYFGGLSGTLVALGPTAADGFAIYLSPGTKKAYEITGTGLSQSAFVQIAASMGIVAKA